MARGPGGYRNTSGLRPWAPGRSGNPRGRPPDHLGRSIQKEERDRIVIFGSYLMQSSMDEVEQIAKDEKRPAYQILIARCFLRAAKNGNMYTFNMLLNHIVGKPQDAYALSDE